MTSNAILYTLRCIADIAFPQKDCAVELSPVPMIVVDSVVVVKFPVETKEKLDGLLSAKDCYTEVDSYDNKVKIKVFSLSEGHELFSLVDGSVVVNADLLSVSFALLSRSEEVYAAEFDKYGRFRYCDSLGCRYDVVDIPLVDEYAMLLRKFVSDSFPTLSIVPRSSHLEPTHDIDFLYRFLNFPKAVKTIAGDLLKRKSLRRSWRSLLLYLKSLRDFRHDPYVASLYELVKVSNELKMHSRFYFKALVNGDNDFTYDISAEKTKVCVGHVLSNGMMVGLHGGMDSYLDKNHFAAEKNNLEVASGSSVIDVRQHFLRFDVHGTPLVWQKCGIKHDSTLGFPEHEGFRCGTCHPYPLYDVDNDCVTNVIEHPLIAMDTTLFQYRNLTEEEAFESICRLYERCVAVEGDFVLLWHNTTMFGELESWYRNVYLRLVKFVVKNE